jgi:hypothetical protein
LFLVLVAIVVRKYSLRADATLGKSETSQTWHRISEVWPFPLEDPPPRHPAHGYLLSFVGTALIWIGFLGAGLAANGVLWPLLLLSGAAKAPLPLSGTISWAFWQLSLTSRPAFSRSAKELGCRIVAAAFGRVIARTLLQWPGERTVLLLRSFEDEELIDPRPMSFFQRRLEERLSSALKQLGPVITLGRPSDPMGFAGAARFYSNWQRPVQYLMVHCAAVVVTVGRSEGLWREIETALKRVTQEPSVFLPPVDLKP